MRSRAMKMTPFLIKLVKEKQSKTNKIKYNMAKIKNNAAEIVITAVAIAIMCASCGSTHSVCPSYGKGVTEEMLGQDMYANQTWGEDEQSRPNYVFK
tara:strand:+ start:101 stop:391 length:291 start_codon:yes stop_codon:yes gene_type:complete